MISRRALLSAGRLCAGAFLPPAFGAASQDVVTLKIGFIQDEYAEFRRNSLKRFWREIWPEAARALGRCNIEVQTTWKLSHFNRSPAGFLHFQDLTPHVINIFLTNHMPLSWDNGRALSGVATRYNGYCLCVLALDYAHGNQIPFFGLNTCLHEILHVLLGDIEVKRPTHAFLGGQTRESRVDAVATSLWLLGRSGADLREKARAFIARA